MALSVVQPKNDRMGLRGSVCAHAVSVGAAVLVLLFASGSAGAAESEVATQNEAVEKVSSDLTAFLKNGAVGSDISIEIPQVSNFRVDPKRHPGEIRTELSTRALPPYRGRVPVTVTLFAGDRLIKRAIVSPYILIPQDVVVATRDLRRGEVLMQQDLEIARRDQARLGRGFFASAADIVGMRMRRSVRQGSVILESATEEVPVVERGDRVIVVLESGAMKLQSIGLAKEAGAIGQWIRVQNTESKRELSGRLDGSGRVHVAF